MAIKSNRLGPGTLVFGAPASPSEWGAQVTACTLTPRADEGDTITVLSGEELVDDGEETWTLEGTLLQSYDEESLLIWAHENSGTELEFEFTPVTGSALRCSGRALIRSVAVGGEVKTRNTSDFSFRATNVQIGSGSADGLALAQRADARPVAEAGAEGWQE